MTDNEKMTDNDLIIGLARSVCFLVSELLAQGQLDREKAIKQFRSFSDAQGDEAHERATKFFVDQIALLMESDPSRPPPATVIPLPRC
jgi:hypothetical protein